MTHPDARMQASIDSIVRDYIDEMSARTARNRAFKDALLALFRQYDGPEVSHMVRGTRGAALTQAVSGSYAIRTRGELSVLASSWRVPPDTVVAVHSLIYK